MLYSPVFRMETMRKIAERLFGGAEMERENAYDVSPANIYEGEQGYLIQIAAPGVKAEDVAIDYVDDVLKITVRRAVESGSGETKKLLRSERGNYDFTRSFSLTPDIDVDKIEAKVSNGLLMIHLPKKPESQPRKIEVKVK